MNQAHLKVIVLSIAVAGKTRLNRPIGYPTRNAEKKKVKATGPTQSSRSQMAMTPGQELQITAKNTDAISARKKDTPMPNHVSEASSNE